MRARWLVAYTVALVACRPLPPVEPLEQPVAQQPTEPPTPVVARTERRLDHDHVHAQYRLIDAPEQREATPWTASTLVPNPTERLLHWPLSPSEHPELAPSYPVAAQLAEPSLDWIALCGMGAQHRSSPSQAEQIRYLRGWCDVLSRDSSQALDEIVPLLAARDRRLAASVRIDIANILIAEGTVDRARRLIAAKSIDDLVVLDRLAALYVDQGQRDDALEINDLATSSSSSGGLDACMRQGRHIALSGDATRSRLMTRRHYLDSSSPACARLETELTCWFGQDCGDYFDLVKQPDIAELYRAYTAWMHDPRDGASEMRTVMRSIDTEAEIREAFEVFVSLANAQLCGGPSDDMWTLVADVHGKKNFPPDLEWAWDHQAWTHGASGWNEKDAGKNNCRR
ncbi:MAG TPA: hypothetical protein VGM90_33265 [Kofleriaceae bacterium]|jgi:hypothetical protein